MRHWMSLGMSFGITHRRLKIFACLLVACGLLLACGRSHAQVNPNQCGATLAANAAQATIQNALNACGDGGYVQLSPGTTSVTVSNNLKIPCGRQLLGAPTTPATTILDGGGAVGFITSVSGACASAYDTGYSYIRTQNGGGTIVDQNSHANLTFLHNTYASIPDAASANSTSTTYALQISMGYPSTINGLLFEYNQVSDANSCTHTISRTYVSNPSDGTGGADGCGIEIFGQGSNPNYGVMNNAVIRYNTFTHVDEGIHFYGSNYTTGTLPINYCNNCDIEYNWFSLVRRITIEFQAQTVGNPLIISNNVFGPSGYGNFNTYYISTPCCQFGTQSNAAGGANPAYVMQNNLMYSSGANTCTAGVGCNSYEWGAEYWGNNSVSNYNLIQGLACTGYEVGYNGSNGGPYVQYNTLQGPIMAGQANCVQFGNGPGAYLVPEFNRQYYGGSISPNSLGATPTSFASVAPTLTPAAGSYTSPPTITLSDPGYTAQSSYLPHGNTSIWYTTDGSTPVPGSGTAKQYSAPFPIVLPVTIKAVGMWGTANQPLSYPAGCGFTPSPVVAASYTSSGGLALTSVAVVTAGNANTLNVGQTLQASAACTYSNGATTNCSTADAYGNAVSNWASSTAALAVSSSGLVTAVSAGTGSVTATVAGQQSPGFAVTATAQVLALSGVTLATSGGVTTLVAGGVNQLVATCAYSDHSSDNCTLADAHGNDADFSSAAPAVATVSNSGLATAQAAGTANLRAQVQFGAAASSWGQPLENTGGFTSAGFLNAQYVVLGTQAGGYAATGGTCSFYLPAGTLTPGSLYDCGLTAAPTATTQATAMQCWGTYTVSSSAWPGGLVTVPMNSCGTGNLAAGSVWWVEVETNQPGQSAAGFYNCGGSCAGAAPVNGAGTGVGSYPCGYVANSYGMRSGMAAALHVGTCGPGSVQAAQYVTLGQPPIVSNAVQLAVTAAPPTLTSVALTAAGSPSVVVVGTTVQFAAKCTYSNQQVTDCTVADIYGNAVSTWASSNGAAVTVGAVGAAHPGLATAVGPGAAGVQAFVGPMASAAYALSVGAAVVTITGVTLATTNGVTGLFVGFSNALVARCEYSDGSATVCTQTDARGTAAGQYASSAPGVATVNSNGVVTGVAPGTTMLTAQAGGVGSAAIPLTVLAVPNGTYTIVISGPVKFSGTVQF